MPLPQRDKYRGTKIVTYLALDVSMYEGEYWQCQIVPLEAYHASRRHVFIPSPRLATDLLTEDWRDRHRLLWLFRAGGR